MSIKSTSLRVRQSMLSMVLGRPVSAIGGLIALVLLSRSLEPKDYGGYFAVWAVVEIAILASNFGLLHAVYRYVHADETSDGVIRPYGPVWRLVGWRAASLLVILQLLQFAPNWTTVVDSPAEGENALLLIGIVVFSEGMARFVEAVFDSMLCQGRSQLTLTLRTIFRLSGIAVLLGIEQLGFQEVLVVDAIATSLGALIGLVLLVRLWQSAHHEDSPRHKRPGFLHMTRFALPAYGAQVLGITYGPDALKLALGGVAGSAVLAVFGFAYSLAAVIQRYMPANLLAGILRPVFVSAARRQDAAEVLPSLVALVVKINWILILPILAAACFGGGNLLAGISGGTYADAGLVLVLILAGLLMVATHQTLSLYCLAREDSWTPLLATTASSVSLPLGIWLAGVSGASGIGTAFLISELIWSLVCFGVLRFARKELQSFNYASICKMLLASMPGVGVAWLLGQYFEGTWIVQACIAGIGMPATWLLMRPLNEHEVEWLQAVFPLIGKLRRRGR